MLSQDIVLLHSNTRLQSAGGGPLNLIQQFLCDSSIKLNHTKYCLISRIIAPSNHYSTSNSILRIKHSKFIGKLLVEGPIFLSTDSLELNKIMSIPLYKIRTAMALGFRCDNCVNNSSNYIQ